MNFGFRLQHSHSVQGLLGGSLCYGGRGSRGYGEDHVAFTTWVYNQGLGRTDLWSGSLLYTLKQVSTAWGTDLWSDTGARVYKL